MKESHINGNGKRVFGAANTTHQIYTVHGGVEEYEKDVAKEYFAEFVDANPEVATAISAKQKRSNFKLVK